jgi:hypothetical protein
MPQYKKVFDIGTYTGNGGQYRVGIPTLRGVGPSGKQVAGATRFRLGVPNYLTRTPGSTTSQTTSTWSFWVKKSALATDQQFFTAATSNHSSNPTISYIGFNSSDQLVYYSINNNVMTWNKSTNLVFRDTSVWTHFIVVTDTTNATSSNRIKIYVNGSEVTSWSNDSQPSQNATGFFNSSSATHVIGREAVRNRYPLDGYMSEAYFVDGQALTPSSFGEYNSDGIWVPKAYSGTYGTNGFYLPMNSSSNYATDQSGNGNNFTPSGFNTTTANTTYDIMTDSPTDYLSGSMTTANNAGNYATWSPLSGDNYVVSGSAASISNGNLDFIANQNVQWASNRSNWIIPTSGKWYFEATLGGSGAGSGTFPVMVGVMLATSAIGTPNPLSGQSYAYMYSSFDGKFYNNNTYSITGSTWASGDVIGIALDIDNGAIYFSKNGTWQNSGSPTSGASKTGAIFTTSIAGTRFTPCASHAATSSPLSLNGGQRAFTYTPPSGYTALNTYNYPRPTDSSLWFYGDTPDLMWIKNRSTTGLHTITDTVRGMGLNLVTSSTAAETSYPGVTEMNKFGMSIINDSTSILNGSTNSHVYWGWKAGGATVTNTSGSITSQVSANPSTGFSIVNFTSAAPCTVGHGLGIVPNFIIMKSRDNGSGWSTYHSSIGSTGALNLQATTATSTSIDWWRNTPPTSSVFTIGANIITGWKWIAYCWTAIPGYSDFGSYTGNGSTDGPFVYLGFRPRWLLIKRTDTTTYYWWMWDTSRNTYNPTNSVLNPNVTDAEATATPTYDYDFLSNGFKLRSSSASFNGSGGTYVYAAFAEIPFKYARAR